MSAVDDHTRQDEDPRKKGSFRIVNTPENQGRVEIGFIPYQIEAPAHLAGFPRNILFAKARAADGGYVGQVCYYPDPDSFVEDGETKRMAYYRRESRPYWMIVIFEKKTGGCQTFRYRDGKRVRSSSGPESSWALIHTRLVRRKRTRRTA